MIVIPHNVQDLLMRTRHHLEVKSRNVHLKNFWKILLLVGAFYGLPSVQFVMFQYEYGDAKCYFNYKCAHNSFGIFAFNNVVSNLGYIIGGFVILMTIYLTRPAEDGQHGLHTDMSLYYTMGLSVILEGFFSALYHVCPSRLNFQFDAAFMIIGSGLLFITLYQKRHAALASGPFQAFGVFAGLVFLDLVSLLPHIPPWAFWCLVTFVYIYVSLRASVYLYTGKSLSNPELKLRRVGCDSVPAKSRLFAIAVANCLGLFIIINSAVDGIKHGISLDFSSVALGIMVLNFFVYLFYYIAMKYYHGERVIWWIWPLFISMLAFCSVGIYFFEIAVTNKFLSFEESQALNKPCVLFHYFDYHDIWHFLSACGLSSLMLLVYVLDLDLKHKERSSIPVF